MKKVVIAPDELLLKEITSLENCIKCFDFEMLEKQEFTHDSINSIMKRRLY